MKLPRLCCIGLLMLPLAAQAIDPGPASPQQQETEGWLLLQSRNKAASQTPQAATPTERDLAYQRWLQSFSHPIPEFFEQEAGGKAGGSK